MPKIFLCIKAKGLAQKCMIFLDFFLFLSFFLGTHVSFILESSKIVVTLFLLRTKMNTTLTLACFVALFQLTYAVPECYHAWAEVIAGKSCKVASDCGEAAADCIFSVATNSRICCKPKSGATLPTCPSGMQILSVGKNSGIVCTSNDQCPDGFKCVESTTNFDKLPGQGNKVCCH